MGKRIVEMNLVKRKYWLRKSY